mgnify:FL=1
MTPTPVVSDYASNNRRQHFTVGYVGNRYLWVSVYMRFVLTLGNSRKMEDKVRTKATVDAYGMFLGIPLIPEYVPCCHAARAR